MSSYKQAVEQSKAGHFREARASLASCMEATACGGLVPKCKAYSEKIAEKMSSVIPVVVDEGGTPQLEVEVKVDGSVVTSHLDGMGILVEPGAHEFVFSNARGVIATQKVLVLEGQRDRAVTVTVPGGGPSAVAPPPVVASRPAPKAAPETKPVAEEPEKATSEKDPADEPQPAVHAETTGGGSWAMPRSAFPYILGGVGVAGLVAGGLLTFWGNDDTTRLENQCMPNCSPASNDHIRGLFLAADVSLGVGAAALAVTTFLVATSRSKTAEKPVEHTGVLVDVAPTRSGAMASVSGSF